MTASAPKLSYRDWHIPFRRNTLTLANAIESLIGVKAESDEVPLMVQLVENPRYSLPGVELFHGAVTLEQHDYIHIILGRGLVEMDEAFTIGFTMGSTKKVSTTEEALYGFASKYLYPKVYQFSDQHINVFKDAVKLGYISSCDPLDEFDFDAHKNKSIREVREILGLEEDLILAYFSIEKRRFPDSIASQRLLNI